MSRRTAFYIFLFGIFFLLCVAVFSQKTAAYTNPEKDFQKGLELFQKQKYGAAQKQFSGIIARCKNEPGALLCADAEYYSAICALELFHKDGELLLKNFIASHPENPRIQAAYFHLGKHAYRKKQYNKAIDWFAKVDVYDLSNEEISEFFFKRGYSYFEEDSMENAKKDFYEIKDIDNKYAAPATYYFAHISYREKNYETALQHFVKLKRNEYFGSIMPYYIFQIFFLQQKYDSAIAYAVPLLDSTTPKRAPEVNKIIGESYYRTARYQQALPYLEKYKKLVGLLNREEWYQLGFTYYKNGDYAKAIDCFQNAAGERDSLAQNAHYHLADCYIKRSPHSGGSAAKLLAKNSFEAAYKLNFDQQITEDALFNFAKLSYELSYNPFNEAISSLNYYIRQYPASPRVDECYKYLVNVYLSTKNYKEAMKSIESVKELNEEMKAAYQKIAFLYGLQLFADQQFTEAIQYLQKSLKHPMQRSYTALAFYWKGESYYKLSEKPADAKGLDSAIVNYKKFLASPEAVNEKEFHAAQYNLGYANFKKTDYKEASSWFRKFVLFKDKPADYFGIGEGNGLLNDAYLRIGDCFFMLKDFYNAVDYYDEALQTGKRDADYAMYQKALALGVLGKHKEKIKTLTAFSEAHTGKSPYEAAAKYEMANTYLQVNHLDSAFTFYRKVVNGHPECSYTKRSLLQMGLIQFREKEFDTAIGILDSVLVAYPKTNEAFEAINAMHDIYRAKNDLETFEQKLKNIPYAAVSLAKLDSSNFDVAFDFYDRNDCENAVKNFMKYIHKYPDGIFILDAMFYKAECDYSAKKFDHALGGYQYVIDKPYNFFTEASLMKAAEINFRNKVYQSALHQFIRLSQIAEYPANIYEGKIGTMRCHWLLGNYDLAVSAAENVIAEEKISDEIKSEAHLIIGKSSIEKQNFDLAANEFSAVISSTKSEKSAEAKYLLGYVEFLKGKYKESQKIIFELINQKPGYDYWIAKGFILLADNYAALQDNFNAKYALQAVIEKSPSAELAAVAKEKLKKILQEEEKVKEEEKRKKEKQKETIQIQFTPDNPKDSVLYKE